MPLPQPNKNENQDDWVDRCMSSDIMNEDYPDNKQRYAICMDIWRRKDEDKREEKVHERRYFEIKNLPPLELRFDVETQANVLTGYAAKFNLWSQDLGGYREKIKNGAFKKTIQEADVRALFNHDQNYVLGRKKNGTLVLWEDEIGLGFNIHLPDTSYAKDLKESIKRGDISQNSFGFTVIKDEWFEDDNGKVARELQEVRLFDVSVVTFPAYEDTDVKLRKAYQNLGINYAFIADILSRSKKQPIKDFEKKLIEETIGHLRSYINKKEESDDNNSFESQKNALLFELERRKRNFIRRS